MKMIDTGKTHSALRLKIVEKGMSPKDVQEALGLQSVQAVYRWLSPKGKTLPSLDNIVELSGLLGCTVDELLCVYETKETV